MTKNNQINLNAVWNTRCLQSSLWTWSFWKLLGVVCHIRFPLTAMYWYHPRLSLNVWIYIAVVFYYYFFLLYFGKLKFFLFLLFTQAVVGVNAVGKSPEHQSNSLELRFEWPITVMSGVQRPVLDIAESVVLWIK